MILVKVNRLIKFKMKLNLILFENSDFSYLHLGNPNFNWSDPNFRSSFEDFRLKNQHLKEIIVKIYLIKENKYIEIDQNIFINQY